MPSGRRPSLQWPAASVLWLLVLAVSPAAAVPRATVRASSAAFSAAVRAVDAEGRLTVTELSLEGEGEGSAQLELTRFEVWSPDATVVLQGPGGAPPHVQGPPNTAYFRGHLAGSPASSVMLAVREGGGASGMAFRGASAWALGKPAAPGACAPPRRGRGRWSSPRLSAATMITACTPIPTMPSTPMPTAMTRRLPPASCYKWAPGAGPASPQPKRRPSVPLLTVWRTHHHHHHHHHPATHTPMPAVGQRPSAHHHHSAGDRRRVPVAVWRQHRRGHRLRGGPYRM